MTTDGPDPANPEESGDDDPIERLWNSAGEWETAPIDDLATLVIRQAVLAAWQTTQERVLSLQVLFRVFTARASEDERLKVLLTLGDFAERRAREEQDYSLGVTAHMFLDDPSGRVVATAALQLVNLMAPDEDDPLSVVRWLVDVARMKYDDEHRAAIFGGLIAMGDERITTLLGNCWEGLPPDSHELLAAGARNYVAASATIDFFLRWAEAIADDSWDDPTFGTVAAEISRLAQRARVSTPSRGVVGVVEVDRAYPAWTRPYGEVVRHPRRWSLEEYALQIAPRLFEIGRRERGRRIFPDVLADWGLPDVPHLEAVARAAEGIEFDGSGWHLLDKPIEVDTLPGKDQTCLVEFGVLNPNGPTICQFATVPLPGGHLDGLVWTSHHVVIRLCLLCAVGQRHEPEALARALASLFASNGWGQDTLIQSLPHWVAFSDDAPLSREQFVEFLASAHRRELERNEFLVDGPLEALGRLLALQEDPVEGILREERESLEARAPIMNAVQDGDRETAQRLFEEFKERHTLKAVPDVASYRKWFDVAASPENVQRLRPHFEGAMAEAIRRFNLSRQTTEAE